MQKVSTPTKAKASRTSAKADLQSQLPVEGSFTVNWPMVNVTGTWFDYPEAVQKDLQDKAIKHAQRQTRRVDILAIKNIALAWYRKEFEADPTSRPLFEFYKDKSNFSWDKIYFYSIRTDSRLRINYGVNTLSLFMSVEECNVPDSQYEWTTTTNFKAVGVTMNEVTESRPVSILEFLIKNNITTQEIFDGAKQRILDTMANGISLQDIDKATQDEYKKK